MEEPGILAISKGLGIEKQKYLKKNFSTVNVLTVKEPSEDLNGGIVKIMNEWRTGKYDVLLVGSRGGRFIEAIDCFEGPIVLISAMVNKIPKKSIVTWIHGENDLTIPLLHVRNTVDLYPKELIELVVLKSDHSLGVITEDSYFKDIVIKIFEKSKERVKILEEVNISRRSSEKKHVSKKNPLVSSRNLLLSQIRLKKRD